MIQKNAFYDRNRFVEMGGMKQMGKALERGMNLVVSMWDDIQVSMNKNLEICWAGWAGLASSDDRKRDESLRHRH